MSEALRTISNEHRSMWQLTVVLEELCKQIGLPEQRPDAELFGLILDYIEQYIERVHQPKEETYLYRAVLDRTTEGNALIAEFEREHAESPAIVAGLRHQLHHLVQHYPDGADAFRAALEAYVAMLRGHILREENELFPLARSILTEEDWDEIDTAFANQTDPQFGEQARAEFRALMSRIVNQAPAPVGLNRTPKPRSSSSQATTSFFGRVSSASRLGPSASSAFALFGRRESTSRLVILAIAHRLP